MSEAKNMTPIKITKAGWEATPKHLKKRHKDGTRLIFNETDKTWTRVVWDR